MAANSSKSQKAKHVVGITLCSLLLILAFCGRYFDSALKTFAEFFPGAFGMAFYGIMIAIIAGCSFGLSGKRVRIPAKYVANFVLLFISIVLLGHLLTSIHYTYFTTEPNGSVTNNVNGDIVSYEKYVGYLFNYYDFVSFGGVVFGSVVYVFQRVLTFWGALILFVGLLLWCVYVAGDFFYCYFTGKITLLQPTEPVDAPPAPTITQPVEVISDDDLARKQAYDFLFNGQGSTTYPEEISTPDVSVAPADPFPFAEQSQVNKVVPPVAVQTAESILFGNQQTQSGGSFFEQPSQEENFNDDTVVKGYFNTPEQDAPRAPVNDWKITTTPPVEQGYQPPQQPQQTNYGYQPAPQTEYQQPQQIYQQPQQPIYTPPQTVVVQQPVYQQPPQVVVTQPIEQPVYQQPQTVVVQPQPQPTYQQPQVVVQNTVPVAPPQAEPTVQQVYQPTPQYFPEADDLDVVDTLVEEEPYVEPVKQPAPQPVRQQPQAVVKPVPQPQEDMTEIVAVPKETKLGNGVAQVGFDFPTKAELKQAEETIHNYMPYVAPPTDLLKDATIVADNYGPEREQAAQRIINKLAVFGIKVELAEIVVGPSVTRYMFKVLSEKTRMGDFNQYSDDLKGCLEATDDIRIEAPVQGTNMVGIEVANKKKTPVMLRSILESDTFQKAKGDLVFAIGKDLIGNVIVKDLAKMPHVLVAGTTGSGKSVALNCLIVSMMYKYGPEYLRFVMVDPKFVELSRYNGIPHMLTRETIINMSDALAGMDYLIKEMEARYQLFKQTGVDQISTYNSRINPKLQQRLPYLVYIVDELADLMATNKKAFEEKLGRLTAKARACGIHVVLATQRPDVGVITGTIKNNLSCRMALKVPSSQDSRTIINCGGADKLLGNGDMLFMTPDSSALSRLQGAYVSNDEIRSVVQFLGEQNELFFDDKISKEIFVSTQEAEIDDDVPQLDGEDEIPLQDQREYRILSKKALKYWLEERRGLASISSLQRGIRVGFNKAGTVYDILQKMGYIEKLSDSEPSSRAVKVLVKLEQLDELFPDVSDEDMKNAK